MDSNQHSEILLKLQELQWQVGRLVSDAESEKEFRKQRNMEIEKRMRDLEQWKSEIHGRIIASVTIIGVVLGTATTIVVSLIK